MLWENSQSDFHESLSKGRTWDTEDWNIFGMLQLNPWILGRLSYFPDPCFVVILRKNEWTDFNEMSGIHVESISPGDHVV